MGLALDLEAENLCQRLPNVAIVGALDEAVGLLIAQYQGTVPRVGTTRPVCAAVRKARVFTRICIEARAFYRE